MTYKRGDIVLVLFPHTDFVTIKKRPALVVQADDLNTGFDNLLLAEITSNLRRRGLPSRIFVPLSSGAGLLQDSVILCDMVMSVETSLIDKKIGAMPSMKAVDLALKAAFGL